MKFKMYTHFTISNCKNINNGKSKSNTYRVYVVYL